MKVGIIVHSHTGNTLKAAEKVRERLREKGHEAVLLRVSAKNEERDRKNIILIEKPDTDCYDALVFGAPVWAFSLSPVMREYLTQIKSLKGKRVGCLVTMGLPRPWMGGKRAVRQMSELCRAKGADVAAAELILWQSKNLDQYIEAAAEKLSSVGARSDSKKD